MILRIKRPRDEPTIHEFVLYPSQENDDNDEKQQQRKRYKDLESHMRFMSMENQQSSLSSASSATLSRTNTSTESSKRIGRYCVEIGVSDTPSVDLNMLANAGISIDHQAGVNLPLLNVDYLQANETMRISSAAGKRKLDSSMDFAIWQAYQNADFIPLMETLKEQDRGHDANFQRPSDGLTGLMAACFHARQDCIRQLLFDYHSDPTILDNFGYSAIDHLMRSKIPLDVQRAIERTIRSAMGNYVYAYYKLDSSKPVRFEMTEEEKQDEESTTRIPWLKLEAPKRMKPVISTLNNHSVENKNHKKNELSSVQNNNNNNNNMNHHHHHHENEDDDEEAESTIYDEDEFEKFGLDEFIHVIDPSDFEFVHLNAKKEEDEANEFMYDDEEDSNAENYYQNDYPDEEEIDEAPDVGCEDEATCKLGIIDDDNVHNNNIFKGEYEDEDDDDDNL